jgi:N-acetylglutamate synthase-like GNAT family acetyltransferase
VRIVVRGALGSDNDVITRLRQSSLEESGRYRGHIDPDYRPGMHALVLVEGEVVGAVAFVDSGTVREITFVHVHPDARGVGAGDALVAWVIEDATEKGIRALRGTALPGDRATKNLFERNGLVARAIQVERTLD